MPSREIFASREPALKARKEQREFPVSILPPVIQKLAQQYPRIVPIVDAGPTDIMIKSLLDRRLDLVLARDGQTLGGGTVVDQLNVEVLFHDD